MKPAQTVSAMGVMSDHGAGAFGAAAARAFLKSEGTAGSGTFAAASQPFGVLTEKEGSETLRREQTGNRSLVVFDRGDEVTVQAGEEGIRFLLVSGKPIEEPVAWYGPIVMNTRSELEQAVAELNDGTFIKHG